MLKVKSVKDHYAALQLAPSLKPYLLENNHGINHLNVAFINHVFYPLDEVKVSSLEEDSIVTKVHKIFDKESFQEKIEIIACNEASPGGFQIPIGDVIVQLFNNFKPNEYK